MATATNKAALARKLGIARSSLYYRPKKDKEDIALKEQIHTVLLEHPAYGHKRIAMALQLNKKRILRVMHRYKIRPRLLRGKPTKKEDTGNLPTTTSNLAKDLCPIAANALWAGDFTYLVWHGGFVFVATVVDVYTREITGWYIGLRHTADLVVRALEDGISRARTPPQIFHSDQGSEYVSDAYERLLARHQIYPSHSKKSSPWENGYQESFYSQFKLELQDPKRHKTLGELVEAVHQQICYYNERRIHTALKMPPSVYAKTHKQKMALLTT